MAKHKADYYVKGKGSLVRSSEDHGQVQGKLKELTSRSNG